MISDLDETRIKEFVYKTLEEYNKSLLVDKYVENIPVKENQMDHDFKQVGMNGLLERNFFLPQFGSTYIAPQIIGLGRGIALGEAEYFVNRILEDRKIIKNLEKKESFTLNKLIKLAPNSTDTILIIHPRLFFKWLKDPTWGITKITEGSRIADIFPCYKYSSRSLNDKIIAIDKLAASLTYVEFLNDFTKSKGRLDITIKLRNSSQVFLSVRSLIKLHIHDATRIKIIELD